MKCSACGADMGLAQVDLRGDPRSLVAFEVHTFKCSACPQLARRLVFSQIVTGLRNVSARQMLSEPPPCVKHDERVAPHSTWLNAVKNLRSSQMALKERAAAVKTSAWANAVEKLRSNQMALKERAALVKTTDAVRSNDAAKPFGPPSATSDPKKLKP